MHEFELSRAYLRVSEGSVGGPSVGIRMRKPRILKLQEEVNVLSEPDAYAASIRLVGPFRAALCSPRCAE
jgi:hypothetical protein